MTEMSPVSPLGYRHLLLAIDCFTKWSELVPLRTKDSFEIAEWFLQEHVPRFGCPRFVRVDSGTEFEGMFRAVCEVLGVAIRKTSAGVPQSNG